MFFRKFKLDIPATLHAQAEHITALEASYQAIMSRYDQQLARLSNLEHKTQEQITFFFRETDNKREYDYNRLSCRIRILEIENEKIYAQRYREEHRIRWYQLAWIRLTAPFAAIGAYVTSCWISFTAPWRKPDPEKLNLSSEYGKCKLPRNFIPPL